MIQHAVNLHSHYKVTFVQFDIAQNTDNILKDISKAVKASKTGSAAVNKIKSEDENVKSLIKSHKIVNYQSIKTGRRKKIEFDVIFSFYCLHWVPNQK